MARIIGIIASAVGKLSYAISPSSTSVNEGTTVTFTVTTTGFGSGTLYWTLTGISGTINNTDFSSPASAVTAGGSVTITNNSGSFAVTLSNDATTEGTESFAAQLRTISTTGTIVKTSSTITVADTSTTPAPPPPPPPTTPPPTPPPTTPPPSGCVPYEVVSYCGACVMDIYGYCGQCVNVCNGNGIGTYVDYYFCLC